MKKEKEISWLLWGMLISYMALIFYLSSLPKIDIYKLPHGLDKILHFFEYGILGFMAALCLKLSGSKRYITIGWVIAFLYGVTDELHQYFVPGRNLSIYDLIADGIGALSGTILLKKIGS